MAKHRPISSTLLRVLSIDKRKKIWYNVSTDKKSEYISKEKCTMNENNKLAVFSNPDFGEVRTLEINGEPWFVLKDVCTVLEIKNHKDVAIRLEEDEKGVASIDTLGGMQNMTIVNESGLYSVILRSDKPQAKPFRKWVTSEVLPSIRKTEVA